MTGYEWVKDAGGFVGYPHVKEKVLELYSNLMTIYPKAGLVSGSALELELR